MYLPNKKGKKNQKQNVKEQKWENGNFFLTILTSTCYYVTTDNIPKNDVS